MFEIYRVPNWKPAIREDVFTNDQRQRRAGPVGTDGGAKSRNRGLYPI